MIQSIATQFNAGGPFMWVILSVFGVAAAVVLERTTYYFLLCRCNSRLLAHNLSKALREDKIHDARDDRKAHEYTDAYLAEAQKK